MTLLSTPRMVPLLALVAMFAGTVSADDGDWRNLFHLARGERIELLDVDGVKYRGFLQAVAAESIDIVSGGSTRVIPRNRVARVSTASGGARVRNAVLLGIVGAVAGAAAFRFGVSCAETDTGCRNAVLGAAGGGAAGAAIGAALPARRTVYRVPSLPARQ